MYEKVGTKKYWIRGNRRRDNVKTMNVSVTGTCCWQIRKKGQRWDEKFTLGMSKVVPRTQYIQRVKTIKC